MDVSIIIVNYKTSKLINDCIRSILEKTQGITYEIIIVDNATEELADVIDSAEDARVRLIQLPENVGFGRANNAGAKIARGRNLFFLNPDTLLLNNAIKILSDYLDTHPECGACGGNLYDEYMQPTLSFRRMLPGIKWELNELSHLMIDRLLHGKNWRFNFTDHSIEVGYITGADLMMPASVIKKTDGFSPEFFMYYEETDLCYRIKRLGWRVINVPYARIQHLEGGSFDTPTLNYERIERSERSRAIYYSKNLPILSRYIANMLYGMFLWSRAKLTGNPSYRYLLKRYLK